MSKNAMLLAACMQSAKGDLWKENMNPGMMLRIDDYSVEAMKSVMQRTIPQELISEPTIIMPEEYHYKYDSRLPGCSWAIDWENIQYSDLDLRP